ncbi:carbohydrate binding domain-containing protein [Hymenobacter edaphi]|nr:carbohydrate binding domain-containing protein [Hymenobacter edaphi]
MRTPLLGAALVALLAACSSDKSADSADQIMSTGFEDLEGWVPPSPSLTKEKAHSGKYAIKVDPTIEYSMTYINVMGKVMPSKPNKLHLTAWVMGASKEADAVLTVQMLNPKDGTSLMNEQMHVKEKIKKPGEWEKVEMEFAVPEKATFTDEMRVYLWRVGSGEPVYMDDIELSIVR